MKYLLADYADQYKQYIASVTFGYSTTWFHTPYQAMAYTFDSMDAAEKGLALVQYDLPDCKLVIEAAPSVAAA